MQPLRVLLDQNVPRDIAKWLRRRKPHWEVTHTSSIGLDSKPDREIFAYAQSNGYLIISFDEDFADQRSFPVGSHFGIIRLHIWPTTLEETQSALGRLIQEVSDDDLHRALVIIDRHQIRIRRPPR